jgi:hypothetical protein
MVVFPDGRWVFKDREVLADRVSAGQLSQSVVDRVVTLGEEIGEELDAGHLRWDQGWAQWTPPSWWRDADLPTRWNATGTGQRQRRAPSSVRASLWDPAE